MKSFFSYDFDKGFVVHKTKPQARKEAVGALEFAQDGEIQEGIEIICWGEIYEVAGCVEHIECNPGDEFDFRERWELLSLGNHQTKERVMEIEIMEKRGIFADNFNAFVGRLFRSKQSDKPVVFKLVKAGDTGYVLFPFLSNSLPEPQSRDEMTKTLNAGYEPMVEGTIIKITA